MARQTTQKPLLAPDRTAVFFAVVFVALGIGDGIQHIQDIFWPIATLLTTPLWPPRKTSRLVLPVSLLVLGAASLIGSSVLSWSPGYSVSAVMRILIGIIWCQRFLELSPQEYRRVPRICAFALLTYGSIGIVPLFFPEIRDALLPFSLLGAPSGHLPIIYLTLPMTAVLLSAKSWAKTPIRTAAIVMGGINALVSFSRLAVLVYGALLYVTARRQSVKTRSIALSILLIGIFSALAPYVIPQWNNRVPAVLTPYLIKNTVTTEPRWAFLREGISGFLAAPVWGTGPGTFSLVSRIFARSQHNISDYPHNVWMLIITETGLFGSILIILAGLWYAGRIRKHASPEARNTPFSLFRHPYSLSVGVFLTFASLQSSLHHYPVWIGLAAFGGLALGPYAVRRRSIAPAISTAFLLIISVYVASWITSDIATHMNNPETSFLLAPYREANALRVLSANPAYRTPIIMFPKNYRMYIAKASHTADPETRASLVGKALSGYPSDTSLQASYLTILADLSPIRACEEMRVITRASLPCRDESFIRLLQTPDFQQLIPLWNNPWGASRFFYAAGLTQLHADPPKQQLAMTFWSLARDLAPQWGYFHIELASLVAAYNNDPKAAIPTLLSCLSDRHAKTQCEGYINDLSALPQPGAFRTAIMAIPTVSAL